MKIKSIFIDFGGVIVRTENKQPRIRVAKSLGMSTRGLEKIIFESESSLQSSLGNITEESHWQAVKDKLNVDGTKVKSIIADFFAGDQIDQSLLTFLRNQKPDRKVVLISNAWSGLRNYITKKGFSDVFDRMIISAEIGMMKPDVRIYELALEEVKTKAEEAVFIDDLLENVESARSIGMFGIHFTEAEKSLAELKSLLSSNM